VLPFLDLDERVGNHHLSHSFIGLLSADVILAFICGVGGRLEGDSVGEGRVPTWPKPKEDMTPARIPSGEWIWRGTLNSDASGTMCRCC